MHGQELMGLLGLYGFASMGLNPPPPPPFPFLALVGAMAVKPTCLVVEVSDTPVLRMGQELMGLLGLYYYKKSDFF
jgi:hypothetical protein